MTSDNLDSKSNYLRSLSSIFQWMPTCAMIIDMSGIILDVNQQAIRFFKASTKEDFIFNKQNIKNIVIDSQRTADLIKIISKNAELMSREILLRRFDKTIISVDMTANTFPDDPNYILIQFTGSHPQSQTNLSQFSQMFRREAQRLKPYLNKPGKILLEEIIISNMLEEIISNKPTRNNPLDVVGEERIEQLTKMFPEFSKNELILCGYLSLKMSMDDISNLTGKTSNSLRVSFHRVLKKTSFSSGKEFLRKLESLKHAK
ncbi:MAG TPA: PAS domain-containing protein [Paludibacter sp.]|nr:PAS domain-containing protein [Paludibacter sp.]